MNKRRINQKLAFTVNFLIILFQPFLIALLTRVLSLEEYGVYSLLFVTISLLTLFFRFGIVEYITHKIPGLKKEIKIRIIITVLAFSSVFLLSMGALLFLFRDFIINLLDIILIFGYFPYFSL